MNLNKPLLWIVGFVLLSFLVSINVVKGQDTTDFELVGDPQNSALSPIVQHIKEIKKGINTDAGWRDFSLSGEHPAIGRLNALVDKQKISTLRIPTKLQLLNKGADSFEVRNLYAKTAQTDTLEHKELVLTFNNDAQLVDAKLGQDVHNYQLALDRNIVASSAEQRVVEKHLRRFQNALAEQDTTLIRDYLASNALIVKGNIARYYFNDSLGPYYQYVKRSPESYNRTIVNNSGNATLKINSLTVYRHPFLQQVYIATFQQRWNSPQYSDLGNVVMVFNLQGEPMIQLRSWQQFPFETGFLDSSNEFITNIPIPLLGSPAYIPSALQTAPVSKKQGETKGKGFLATHKKLLLISAGTTAAISIGAALLTGGGESKLPNPPGRPSFR
ncbi:hypothetical protein [Fodinibius halophilus]|uniref:Uncharacterized protein n=1 Tax=Fodinibius halophilus TaxID=1736908 RepID=A0A6M1SUK9_9BACT|nr:hypothetical protein [Fodinibius halophilus]NGP87658.1 hypothetical protein [Fodinibius halophilus]